MVLIAALTAFSMIFLAAWAILALLAPPVARLAAAVTRELAARAARRHSWRSIASLRPYAPVIAAGAAGFLLLLWAGDGFLDLVERLRADSPAMKHADAVAHTFAAAQRSPQLTQFFLAFTWLGNPIVMGGIVATVATALAITKRYRWSLYLTMTTGLGALLNVALKQYFVRPRPDLSIAVRSAHGTSFPSGHAMGAAIVCGALSYLAYRGLRTWRSKAAVLALSVTVALTIALSRVYLGVHWLSDIAAGLTVGVAWVAITTTTYEVVRRIHHLRTDPGKMPDL